MCSNLGNPIGTPVAGLEMSVFEQMEIPARNYTQHMGTVVSTRGFGTFHFATQGRRAGRNCQLDRHPPTRLGMSITYFSKHEILV